MQLKFFEGFPILIVSICLFNVLFERHVIDAANEIDKAGMSLTSAECKKGDSSMTALGRTVSIVSIYTLIVMGTVSCDSSNKSDAGPKSVVTDYDPQKDGLKFENFAGFVQSAVVNVDAARRMMGDVACADVNDDVCMPTPQTQAWIDTMNGATRGGVV